MSAGAGDLPFLIAGGGIAGLVTALALAQGAGMAIEDAVGLAARVAAARNDLPAAFAAFAAARYLRTGRVQLTARFYGDVYHAAGVAAELRSMLLGGRQPEQAYQGMRWLYSGLDDDGNQVM